MNHKIPLMLLVAGVACFAPHAFAADIDQDSFSRQVNEAGRAIMARAASAPDRFRLVWDGITYACRNGEGDMGYNLADAQVVKSTKEGECAELGKADLSGADLSHADLKGAELSMGNLSGTDFTQANLLGADIGWTTMPGAVLNGALLRGTNLAQCNLVQAKLVQADLEESNLGGSDLSGADFTRADFLGADLVGHPVLRSPQWHDTKFDGAIFTGAKYDGNTKLPFDDAEASRRGMIKIP